MPLYEATVLVRFEEKGPEQAALFWQQIKNDLISWNCVKTVDGQAIYEKGETK